MLVITVARKPLVGTIAQNVTQYGAGGINIDGTRVAADWSNDPSVRHTQTIYTSNGVTGWGQNKKHAEAHAGGRWPSNLILQHAHGCQYLGTDSVRINGGSRNVTVSTQADGAIQFTQKPVGYQKVGYADGARETVESWMCAVGCPIAALDRQAGVTTSQIRVGDGENLDSSREDWRFTRATGGFEDSGGVSRFFKKVGGQRDGGAS